MLREARRPNILAASYACPSYWFTELVKAMNLNDAGRADECRLHLKRLGWSVSFAGPVDPDSGSDD